MKRDFRGSRILILILLALIAPVAGSYISRGIATVETLETLIYDWHFRALPNLTPDDRIVIVGMDDDSLAHLPLERPAYPLPRTVHAELLRKLHEAGAKVVAFDIMFTRDIPNEDAEFAKAMDEQRQVFCGAEPDQQIVEGEEVVRFKPSAPLLRSHVQACSNLATVHLGVVRSLHPITADAATQVDYLHLTTAMAGAYFGLSKESLLVRRSLQWGPIQAPLNGAAELLIRFAGPAGTYKPIPYYQAYSGQWEAKHPNAFRGKIVLVGAVGPLVDHATTPLGDMQGVEILAQATQAMLQGNWIRPLDETENYLLECALCLILAAAFITLGSRRALIAAPVEMAAWAWIAHELFVHDGVWAGTLAPAVSMSFALALSTAYELARMRRVFYRFMPSQVAEHMLKADANEAARSTETDATVVFCDVRNSTKLAETLPSETVENLLHRFFVAGEEAAQKFGTELDKFVGDEIMLYFEDRPGLEPHALRAIRWAFAMQEAAKKIAESGLAGPIGFRAGIGVSSGTIRIGTVGASRRIQHTVMGDVVNTASRLQDISKQVGRDIVVGESAWERVRNVVEGEFIGEVEVRGKEKPVAAYFPLRIKGQ